MYSGGVPIKIPTCGFCSLCKWGHYPENLIGCDTGSRNFPFKINLLAHIFTRNLIVTHPSIVCLYKYLPKKSGLSSLIFNRWFIMHQKTTTLYYFVSCIRKAWERPLILSVFCALFNIVFVIFWQSNPTKSPAQWYGGTCVASAVSRGEFVCWRYQDKGTFVTWTRIPKATTGQLELMPCWCMSVLISADRSGLERGFGYVLGGAAYLVHSQSQFLIPHSIFQPHPLPPLILDLCAPAGIMMATGMHWKAMAFLLVPLKLMLNVVTAQHNACQRSILDSKTFTGAVV